MENRELVVLLPAYNEEKDVERLVKRWEKEADVIKNYNLALKIVVINDGSKDKTREIGEQLARTYSNVKLINHSCNKGLGKAVETGFKYVIEECPNCLYTCLMDCDNTQSPIYIETMLEKVKKSQQKIDVVIASRYQKGAKVYGLAGYRKLTSNGARWVYSTLLHIKGVKDYTCGYRLYTRSILEEAYAYFKNHLIEQEGFTCMAEVLYKLSCIGAHFAEVPFELHYDDKKGASKMKVLKTAKDSIALAFKLRKIRRKGMSAYEANA